MRYIKITAAAALALALCLALASCGGAGASSAAGSSAASSAASAEAPQPSQPSDEELILADFNEVVAQGLDVDAVAASLAGEEDVMQLLDMVGIDAHEYADMVTSLIIFEPKGVKVEGDSAILTVAMTTPDFEAADPILNDAINERLAKLEGATVSEDDMYSVFGDALREVFAYPTMPSQTMEFDVNYEKRDGVWVLTDASQIEAVFNSVTGSF